jgi:hypothetical protein
MTLQKIASAAFGSLLALAFVKNSFSQAVNYGNFFIPTGAVAFLDASFTNSAGSGQNYENNGELILTGSFANNEVSMLPGVGKTRFQGTVLQLILGAEPASFFDIELNNNNNLQQDVDVDISGIFDLTLGSWSINGNQLQLSGTIDNFGNTGTINGSATSEMIIGGSTGGNLGNIIFSSGARLLNNFTMNRSGASASATLGSDLTVNGLIDFTSGDLAINGNTLTLTGNLTGAGGGLTGSPASNLVIGGSNSVLGTLQFTSGARQLNSLSMQRTGTAGSAAAILGTPLTVNAIDLQDGIVATGNNLFTWTGTGSLTPAAQTTYTPNSTSYKNSYICLCTGAGAALSFTSPFDASDNIGFRLSNVTTNAWLPIGVDFDAPNRVRLNNTGTPDDLTFMLGKGDIGATDRPVVRRIWYAYEGTPGGTTADINLYFTKRDPSLFGISQDEVETGFDYTDLQFVQKNYGDPNYVDVSQYTDVRNVVSNTLGTEVYGQYTIGVSPDVNNLTDGINQFTRFTVMNLNSFILPVRWIQFQARKYEAKVQLQWKVGEEANVDLYEVERSADGLRFAQIGVIDSRQSVGFSQYTFEDKLPLLQDNFYRIKAVETEGTYSFSSIQKVNFGRKALINVLPNPIQGSLLRLQTVDLVPGHYQIVLYDISGKAVWQQKVMHLTDQPQYEFNLPQALAAGMYRLVMKGYQTYQLPVIIAKP